MIIYVCRDVEWMCDKNFHEKLTREAGGKDGFSLFNWAINGKHFFVTLCNCNTNLCYNHVHETDSCGIASCARGKKVYRQITFQVFAERLAERWKKV